MAPVPATSNAAVLTVLVPPSILVQPTSASILAGGSTTFSVGATGSAPLAYQWSRNGTAIAGATTAALTLTGVQTSQAGVYTVTVGNAAGTVTSAPATLVVGSAPVAPIITVAPVAVSVIVGGTARFSVVAGGTMPLTYQWRKDGVAVVGATGDSLVLNSVQLADAGNYSVIVTNAVGTAASGSATLTVSAPAISRISNLSVRTNLASGQTLFVGFVTTGPKPVLIRGVGPGMHDVFPQYFSATDVMADPKLELYNAASTKVDENDNWSASLAATMTSVGAFTLTTGSKDAALVGSIDGPYTAQLKGTGSGVVLVDAYDTTTSFAPRLKNVSARNQVGTGANILIAGFFIDGPVNKTLLIRGIGPALRDIWGLTTALVDPKLEIYNAARGTKIAENDNWDVSLATVFDSVGAYRFTTGSKDAALQITLAPGSYTAQLSGVGNTTGEGVVEVYELP